MVDKSKQIKNTGLYLIPVLVSSALPLITMPVFTRLLTKEDYGAWALAQVYAVFVTGIGNFGLSIGYERSFFEHRQSARAAGLLYATLFFVLTTLSIIGLVTYFYRYQLAKLFIGSSDHGGLLFWSFCAMAIVTLKNYYLIYLKNTENAWAFIWYTIDETLLTLGFSLVFVAWLHVGIIGMVWGQLASSGLVIAILTFRFSATLPVCLNYQGLKDSLRISLPLTPRIFFGVIGSQFDKYMLGLLGTLGGAGVYNIAQKIANTSFIFMTAIQNVYSPQVYQRMFSSNSEDGRNIGRYLTPFLYISAFIGLVVALFAEEAISLLTPKDYHGAADSVTILSLLYVTYFFGKQPQLIYAKKTIITSMLTILGIGLNIAINVPLIRRWGAIGAAFGTFLSGIIVGVVSFFVSQRCYRIDWEYYKIGFIFSILFGSAITIMVMRQSDVAYQVRLVTKMIGILLYVYLGVKIKILSMDNVKTFRGMLNTLPWPFSR